jgi:hypothetical protein
MRRRRLYGRWMRLRRRRRGIEGHEMEERSRGGWGGMWMEGWKMRGCGRR